MSSSDGGGHNPFDIFQSFFGGSPFGGGSSRGRRGNGVVHPLKVSMEDLYLGTSKKFSLSRNVICSKCDGKGTKSGDSVKCSGCRGTGMKATVTHLGSSMIQQVEQPCNDCKGTRETITDEDRCTQCKGEKVVPAKKVLEVVVEKGMRNGQKITFPGEADEAPDTLPVDVDLVLQQEEPPKFARKGFEWEVRHKILLSCLTQRHDVTWDSLLLGCNSEAWVGCHTHCGFQFVLVHLDGRRLLIKSNPGEVVKPDSVKWINDEGMLMHQTPLMKGKLYVLFTVDFPDSISLERIQALEAILPPKPSTQTVDMELEECEETTMHDDAIFEDEFQSEAYDEDEESEVSDEDEDGERVQRTQL